MTEVFKTHTKKAVNDAVALLNARMIPLHFFLLNGLLTRL